MAKFRLVVTAEQFNEVIKAFPDLVNAASIGEFGGAEGNEKQKAKYDDWKPDNPQLRDLYEAMKKECRNEILDV